MRAWSDCLQPASILTSDYFSLKKNDDVILTENLSNHDPAYVICRQPRSLIEICARCLTSDFSLCESSLQAGLTPSLFEHLLTAAVENGRERSIELLVFHWPQTSLSLSRHRGYSNIDYERRLHRWLTHENRLVDEQDCVAALTVIHAFINSLRERAPSKLRILDLREYPSVDCSLNYLTSHVILAYNESQRAGIVRLVQDMASHHRITSQQALAFGDLSDLQTTLPESAYAVVVDGVIDCQGYALDELCKALKISPYSHAHLKLVINQLHLCEVGEDYVGVVMPLLDPTKMVGLNVSFNNLQASGLTRVLSSLEVGKFDALQRLDLAGNSIDFTQSDLACRHFSSAFFRLTQLKRLSLHGNRLSRRLRTVFTSGYRSGVDAQSHRLEYLNVSACSLMESDFIFLSNSSLIDNIKELDLSDNNFASSTSSLCCILKHVRSTVRALLLEKCSLRDAQAERVLSAHMCQMQQLTLLSVADNAWTTEIYRQEFPKLVQNAKTLCGIRLSYAIECYQVDPQLQQANNEEQIELAKQMKKTQFFCSLSRWLEQAKDNPESFMVRLHCVELDEALL